MARLVIVLVICSCVFAADDFTTRVQAAQALFKNADKAAEAEKAFEAIASEFPDKPDGYHWLSVLYLRQERLPEAEKTLQHMLTLQPTDLGTHFNLGTCLAGQGGAKIEEAVEIFSKAVNMAAEGTNPKVLARIFLSMGNACIKVGTAAKEAGDQEKALGYGARAVESYDKCLGIDPNHPDAANNRAFATQTFGLQLISTAEEVRDRTAYGVKMAVKNAAPAEAEDEEDEGVAM